MKTQTDLRTYTREETSYICDSCGNEWTVIDNIFVCDHCDNEICEGCKEDHRTKCSMIYE